MLARVEMSPRPGCRPSPVAPDGPAEFVARVVDAALVGMSATERCWDIFS